MTDRVTLTDEERRRLTDAINQGRGGPEIEKVIAARVADVWDEGHKAGYQNAANEESPHSDPIRSYNYVPHPEITNPYRDPKEEG